VSGVRQLSRLLKGMGFEVRSIALAPPHLHLGGLMSAVGTKAVLSCGGILPKSFFAGFEVIEIPCRDATEANVIALGESMVITEKSNVAATRALRAAGFSVRPINLSEFLKGRGGPTCLILPVERSDVKSQRHEG
jgi:N-dimethylarginine dimethylaminohydrolase